MSAKGKLLTETELELMTIVWKLGEGSVNDVLEGLPSGRKLAYTSVSTMMRILEQKEFLGSRKEGRGHVYYPRISKKEYEATSARDLVRRVFDGDASCLVRRLIEKGDLTREDLAKVRELLAKAPGRER
jgi:predicted transcriptional regulator